MTPPNYEDPREYKTTGMFTQTAPAEALIRYAAMQQELGKMASVHNTAENIREMIIVEGSDISRIIAHFEPMKKAHPVRIETLYIVGPEVQESAETIVARPDLYYHRRSAVPVGEYTEEQVHKKLDFISAAYEEAMAQGAKKKGSQQEQSIDDTVEDPLDLLNIDVDTSEIDAETVRQAREAGNPKGQENKPGTPGQAADQSAEDLAVDYLTGNVKE